MPPDRYAKVCEELELLDSAGSEFSRETVRAGRLTPVFFGSAANNFGVQMLLDRFLELAPGPAPRHSGDQIIEPLAPEFSGFVFKIQANMNPKHRDRVAFIRVVSGAFRRDMTVTQTRTGEKVRLSNSQRLFARERETLDEAWAGDVVGIVGNHDFLIGDTLADAPDVSFDEIPRFAPECFSYIHNENTAKYKRFRDGLDQLMKEGVAQLYEIPDSLTRDPLLGAVGPLQFDVLKYRLESEYGADCRMESAPWSIVRWIRVKGAAAPTVVASGAARKAGPPPKPAVQTPTGVMLALDPRGGWVALFPTAWSVRYFAEQNPGVELSETP